MTATSVKKLAYPKIEVNTLSSILNTYTLPEANIGRGLIKNNKNKPHA